MFVFGSSPQAWESPHDLWVVYRLLRTNLCLRSQKLMQKLPQDGCWPYCNYTSLPFQAAENASNPTQFNIKRSTGACNVALAKSKRPEKALKMALLALVGTIQHLHTVHYARHAMTWRGDGLKAALSCQDFGSEHKPKTLRREGTSCLCALEKSTPN